MFINVGILSAFLAGIPYDGGQSFSVDVLGYELPWWRIMFAMSLPVALAQAAGLALCPESPVWLLRRGRHLCASQSFKDLHGDHYNPSDHVKLRSAASGGSDAEQPLLVAEDEPASPAASEDLGWSAQWQPRYRRAMFLASSVALLQQTSGINTVIFYSSTVFQQAGLQSPVLGSILMG